MKPQAACPRCGAPTTVDATECTACGYVRPPFGQQRRPMPVLTEQRAIASMVCAVMGIVIPFVLGIAGIVLAVRARRSLTANSSMGGRNLAAIGFWLGIVDVLSWSYVAYRIATR